MLTIKTNETAGRLVIAPEGMLDTTTAPSFSEELKIVMDRGSGDILMDLSGLEYISSAGIRAILSLIKTTGAKGGKLAFRGIRPAVMEIFEISGLSQVMTVEQ